MELTKHEQFALLIVKAGVFFANCDGKYDETEQTFIDDYVDRLHGISEMTDNVFVAIKSIVPKSLTIDEIISETNTLLSKLDDKNFEKAKGAMLSFVDKVIAADGVDHPKEQYNKELLDKGLIDRN